MLFKCQLKKKGFDLLNLSDKEKFQVLKEVFEDGGEFKNGELINQIKIVLNRSYKGSKGKGENKIKLLITESKNNGWLIQEGNRCPYKLGKLSV